MKYWYVILLGLMCSFCGDGKERETDAEKAKKQDLKEIPLDQRIKRHILTELNLTAVDKFSVQQFEQDLNNDDVKDLIVTVNLMDRALNDADKSGKPEKAHELGYMGYYNYFIFVDGATQNMSPAIVVPSSPAYQLDIAFAHVLGTGKSDFTVDYRIRNMQRRKFYTVENSVPREICQSVVFDELGTPKGFAHDIRFEKGTFNNYNDIVEYKGILENVSIPNVDSTYSYRPKITPTDIVVRRWHYSPSSMKYFTVQDQNETLTE